MCFEVNLYDPSEKAKRSCLVFIPCYILIVHSTVYSHLSHHCKAYFSLRNKCINHFVLTRNYTLSAANYIELSVSFFFVL